MKKLTIFSIILVFASFVFTQSVIIKDGEVAPNILLQINDEGTTGSITLPTGGTPGDTGSKLYNESGTLKWNGNALGIAGSADGDWTISGSDMYSTVSGNVGIGTTTPTANLHVSGIDGALFTGTYNSGAIPVESAGTRMMWYPKKAAFRVGTVDGIQWDDVNIGDYSIAMGRGTIASGEASTAMGHYTIASKGASTAMGCNTTASGDYSTAMGDGTTASGSFSTAMGRGTIASGEASTAMGHYTTASGGASTAMGCNTTASGDYSTAMGDGTTASGSFSTAIGNYTTASGLASTAMGQEIQASGNYSYAIALNDQNSTNVTQANTMAIMGGKVGIGTTTPGSKLSIVGLPVYADNAAATGGSLAAGDLYRTSTGVLMVTY